MKVLILTLRLMVCMFNNYRITCTSCCLLFLLSSLHSLVAMNHLKSKLPDLIRSYSGTIMHINEYAKTHYSVTIRGYIYFVGIKFFPNLTFTGQNFLDINFTSLSHAH